MQTIFSQLLFYHKSGGNDLLWKVFGWGGLGWMTRMHLLTARNFTAFHSQWFLWYWSYTMLLVVHSVLGGEWFGLIMSLIDWWVECGWISQSCSLFLCSSGPGKLRPLPSPARAQVARWSSKCQLKRKSGRVLRERWLWRCLPSSLPGNDDQASSHVDTHLLFSQSLWILVMIVQYPACCPVRKV